MLATGTSNLNGLAHGRLGPLITASLCALILAAATPAPAQQLVVNFFEPLFQTEVLYPGGTYVSTTVNANGLPDSDFNALGDRFGGGVQLALLENLFVESSQIWTGAGGTVSSLAKAKAVQGKLGVSTDITIDATGGSGLKGSAGALANPSAGVPFDVFDVFGAQAYFIVPDLTVAAVPGATVSNDGTISASYNLELTGSFHANAAGPFPAGSASLTTKLFVDTRLGYYDFADSGRYKSLSSGSGVVTMTQVSSAAPLFSAGTGLLAGYQHGDPLTISVSVSDVPLLTALDLRVRIATQSVVEASGTIGYSGGVDFFNTLSLPSGSPVLTLPEGYTSESTQMGIVGNILVPVPEPSTSAMTLAGIACGGFSMWRRRKRHGASSRPSSTWLTPFPSGCSRLPRRAEQ